MARRPASRNQTDHDPLVGIRALIPGELHVAAAILAEGMLDNPLHVKVFGSDPGRRHRRLLRFFGHLVAYIQSNGEMQGVYMQGEMIGVLGMIKPGRCRPALMDTLGFVRVIATSNPPVGIFRICRWLRAWARNDPVDPHWHIGPLAVRPAYRRRGIGRHLMVRCCQRLDARAATAYLETDLAINVAFYELLGFVVTGHESVLGVPCWFMTRPPSCRAPADPPALPA